MVHAGGAPRTVCPPPEDMIALGKEMVQWIKDHPQTLHLSQWYSFEKFITDKTWDTMRKKEEFIHYYEVALKMIGMNYLDKDSKVRDGISQRWQRVYFKDLKRQEDEDAQEELLRQKELSSAVEADVVKQTEAMNSQMAELRALHEKALPKAIVVNDNHSVKSEPA